MGIEDYGTRKKTWYQRVRSIWIGWFFPILLIGNFSWGSHFIHVGDYKGLDVQTEFYGHAAIASNGEFVYQKGTPMAYRVRLLNRTNQEFSEVEIQSSLHSDGMTCGETTIFPGSKLPGDALSPIHTASIPPGGYYEFETIYTPGDSDCQAMNGHLKIRLATDDIDKGHSTSFISPAHYQFK